MSKLSFTLVLLVFFVNSPIAGFSQETIQPIDTTAVAPTAQEEKKTENFTIVKGVVKEVSKDKSYIMVEDTKILTSKEFLDESYLEVGDNVEITAEKTDAGLKAVSYNYIFDEEPEVGSLIEGEGIPQD